jgi:hypothetical protein
LKGVVLQKTYGLLPFTDPSRNFSLHPLIFEAMSARLIHRTFAGFSALWFAMLMVAGPALHECAMHDGAAAVAETGAHAGHGGAPESSPDDDDRCEHCTCMGDCASSVFVAGPAAAGLSRGLVLASTARIAAHALAPDIGSPDVQLPFALGPPPLA